MTMVHLRLIWLRNDCAMFLRRMVHGFVRWQVKRFKVYDVSS